MSAARPTAVDPLFATGGPMGEVLAARDWTATAVGPPGNWPPALRQVVRILLTSRFSMWMAWGPELSFFYNDAYRRDTLRTKHPWALGRPAREVWAEIWDDIGPRIRSVLDTGEATWDESLLLFLERAGYVEETYHTFSYSPIYDEQVDDRVAGMLCVVSEDTERVLGERRLRVLSELGDLTASAAGTAAQACERAVEVLARHRAAVPFALVYLREGEHARLVATSGIVAESRIAAATVPHPDRGRSVWRVATGGPAELRTGLAADYPGAIERAVIGDAIPTDALVLPLTTAGGGEPIGVLVAGINPYRKLDDDHRAFFDLVAGAVSTAVTDAEARRHERRRAAELAELDRAKTEFFANVSHEFRTPLTLIAGPAEDGLADAAHPLPDVQRERLEVIARSSRRLRRLVDTLLEFSRLEAGRLEPAPTTVDLAALTRGIAGSFAPAVERAGLELVLDCPPLGSAVTVDAEMWEKIVLNLLSNAVKYTHEGRVHMRLCRDGGAGDGGDGYGAGGVVLLVTDTGIGIPAAEQPALFQRFHRVRGATGRSVEGSGIGLALVAELTALHGGTVGVRSIPGQGSTFTVTLPRSVLTGAAPVAVGASAVTGLYREEALQWAGPGAPAARPPAVAPGSTAGATVLVVDDNRDLRGFLAGLLAPHYTVLEAADGRAGLDRARTEHPDLVLTDVTMPGLDGFALLAALRADPATATIPVIVLSARAGEEATVEGLFAGADDYLVKPFSSHDLLARVRSNLELAGLRNREGAYRTALVESMQDAFLVVDAADGAIVEMNQATSELLGLDAGRLPIRPPYPHFPTADEDPDELALLGRHYQEAVTDGRGHVVVPVRHARTRARLWVSASFSSARYGGRKLLTATMRDVTEQHRAARHDRLLADTGELLARRGELGELLARFTELAAPVLADVALVSLLGPDGRLAPAAAAHRGSPDSAQRFLDLVPYTPPDDLLAGFRSGRAFAVGAVTDEMLAERAAGEADLVARRALGVRSSLIVPLVVDGRLLGSLSFVSTTEPRAHDATDLALAEELGRRVAGMVHADQVATRERRLQAITSALGAAATVDEVAVAFATGMDEALGAAGVAVFVARPDDPAHLHLVHTVGYPPEVADAFAVIRRDADLPAAEAARTGAPIWLGDPQAWRDRYPHMAVPEAADDARAVAVLPLCAGEQLAGVLALSFPTARRFPAEERAFATTLAGQAALALDRTIAADDRRRIADTLQRGLLPPGLPRVPRLALAARYLPAGTHTAAGGDWYDVTVLDDEHVAIAVGDVVGQGTRAAAVMGQLRSALSAYLLEGRSPAQALTWLSRFARNVDGARASTAICLVLHTATGELCWARAGHLPPLVVDQDSGARFLDDAHGTVLGVTGAAGFTEGRATLAPGQTVVLYTDGLVERRGEVLDDGLDRIVAAARVDLAPARLLPDLLHHALGADEPADDVAVVAARLLPGPLECRLPAQPVRLRELRRAVARWAAAAGLPGEQVDDLQLALGEAAANAVEHAYRGRAPGEFRYRLDVDGSGDVRVEIGDEGTWQPLAEPGYRGRGLAVISELARDVDIVRGDAAAGTVVTFTVPAPQDRSVQEAT
ncbi:MAG: SpoIIE family protein phosphatase [Pseudonocardia sp.]